MTDRCGNDELLFRDGASQRGRRLPALDPGHFSVEERSPEDLLRFARRFAEELKFFTLDNQWDGHSDWTGFLGVQVDDPQDSRYEESQQQLHNLLAFLDDPDRFKDQPDQLEWLTRPHLSVFLAFLEMLKEPKRELDELTRRHLDFYYREALQLPEKPAVPDRVHVLFEPARGVDAHRIEAGTLLYGGKDSGGKDLHYATEEDLLVTQARVVDVRRVFRDTESGSGRIYADISWQEGQDIDPNHKYHALGKDLIDLEEDNPHLAQIGFAVSSPLLELSEGERIIKLSVTVPKDSPLNADLFEKAFTFALSIEEGWWTIPPGQITDDSPSDTDPESKEVILGMTVSSDAPAIVTPVEEGSAFPFPVLRAEFRQSDLSDEERQALLALQPRAIQLKVDVNGLSSLAIRNEEGVLSTEAAFLPFGGWPRVGAPFTFAHAELCRKSLESLTLHITWKDKPADIDGHYQFFIQKYQEHLDADFSMNLPFKTSFQSNESRAERRLNLFSAPLEVPLDDFNLFSNAREIEPDLDDPLDFPRYFKWVLESPDFQHAKYPRLLPFLPDDQEIKKVNPPYTPEIGSLTVDYTSKKEVLTTQTDGQDLHQFYHWQPFGYVRPCEAAKAATNGISLLPPFPEPGNLYIGLSDVASTARLSLLFQLHPGFSDADQPDLQWSYLEHNCWRPIPEKQVLVDHTRKLLQAGIVQIELPEVTDLDHQVLPAGRYWLRASAANPKAAGDLVAVHTQAVAAAWTDNGNAPDHLDRPLPAESITELLRRDPNIQSVTQPYTSFGARPAEAADRYHTRVSERLRHKQRALSGWDYERLVLDRFPDVYKVKCLSPGEKPLLPAEEGLPGPGDVILVVIPNIARAAPFFPLEPRLSNDKREEIKAYLQQFASPFTRIEVRNPRFEYVLYRMDIRFHKGYDDNLYAQKLNEALHRFLCPWAYEASADIAFGSRIFHSEVIYFIEKLPYVDYVVNFKLARQYEAGDNPWGCIDDVGCAAASYPDSILVSHREHFIGPVVQDDYDPDQYKGIGYEIIGVDHRVH